LIEISKEYFCLPLHLYTVAYLRTILISKNVLLTCSQQNHIIVCFLSDFCRNSVRLAIRKLTYAPEEPAPQPSAEATKEFMMSPGNIKLEASLDKEVFKFFLALLFMCTCTTGQLPHILVLFLLYL
jgi:hypothetical protein